MEIHTLISHPKNSSKESLKGKETRKNNFKFYFTLSDRHPTEYVHKE